MSRQPKKVEIDAGTLLFIICAVLLVPLLLSGFLFQ